MKNKRARAISEHPNDREIKCSKELERSMTRVTYKCRQISIQCRHSKPHEMIHSPGSVHTNIIK